VLMVGMGCRAAISETIPNRLFRRTLPRKWLAGKAQALYVAQCAERSNPSREHFQLRLLAQDSTYSTMLLYTIDTVRYLFHPMLYINPASSCQPGVTAGIRLTILIYDIT
jgi:hypothetical protein